MFSTAVNMFHGSSSTETPHDNFHQLTAPDIDLNEFKFASLANEARATFCCFGCRAYVFLALTQLQGPCHKTIFIQVVLVVNVASK